ncbi:MAG: DNA glycosylase AlkZ-like family protein [Stellaceae bacterium]
MPITLDDLRHFAVARSIGAPTTLERALEQQGFVQADPIRAPARAQDLTLRHRVRDYRAGDLERRYTALGVEEDFFINYGFVTRALQALMHPRTGEGRRPWTAARRRRALALLEFVRERGAVHPREVDARFAHGTIKNYWGGSSNVTTHLLDVMHYRGMLRVARREGGIRIYAEHRHGPEPSDEAERRARLDRLIDVAVGLYAPLPARSLSILVRGLRSAVPQWRGELGGALARTKERLGRARVDGVDWYWPAAEDPARAEMDDTLRLLAPFDPIVRDRDRFEAFWGWVYRFEAYTPARKRKLGYYALPLLWRGRVIGWANLAVREGTLVPELGYVAGKPPRDRVFKRELEAELERMRVFLDLEA